MQINVNIKIRVVRGIHRSWWRHQMETFSALLALFAGNSPVPAQRPVTRSFDVFFYLRLNRRLSKQPWGWWFETPSWSLWRQCNVTNGFLSERASNAENVSIWWLSHAMVQPIADDTLVPSGTRAEISNYIHDEAWDEITYPSPNISAAAV